MRYLRGTKDNDVMHDCLMAADFNISVIEISISLLVINYKGGDFIDKIYWFHIQD